jgi:glycosyl transferase family 87
MNVSPGAAARGWFLTHRRGLLRLVIAVLTIDAAAWLGWEFWRLLWQPGPMGAIDLGFRHEEVHRWFAGLPVYEERRTAVYPPATFAILWPLLGWLGFASARWLWAATTIAAMAWMIVLCIRGSGAQSTIERAVIALMVLATYPAGAAIGNGQMTIHMLASVLTAVLWAANRGKGWHRFFLVVLTALFSMAKPTSAVTFLLIVVFLSGGLARIGVSALAYLALTLFAASFQPGGVILQLEAWLTRATSTLGGHTDDVFYANVHAWLSSMGLARLMLPASLLILAALALWTHRNRRCDVWLLLSVTAAVTRFWTYHRWYDDLLLLVSMVGLLRVARTERAADRDVIAGGLFAAGLVTMLAPGGLYLLPAPWNRVYTTWETLLWLMQLAFLVRVCGRERVSSSMASLTGQRGRSI